MGQQEARGQGRHQNGDDYHELLITRTHPCVILRKYFFINTINSGWSFDPWLELIRPPTYDAGDHTGRQTKVLGELHKFLLAIILQGPDDYDHDFQDNEQMMVVFMKDSVSSGHFLPIKDKEALVP